MEDLFESIVAALEKMTDAQDDMWHEEQHCNYRERTKIKEQRFVPAKAELKAALDSYIDQRIADKLSNL